MADIEILKAELALTTPINYPSLTDQQAVDSLNDFVVDAPPDGSALLQYITLERFRTGNLLGRMKLVAETRPIRAGNAWEIPPVPLADGAGADVTPTHDQIASAAAFMRFLDVDTGFAVSLLDSRIDTILTDLVSVGAIGGGDKTAIQALSQNQQSRGIEIGFGLVKLGHVQEARA